MHGPGVLSLLAGETIGVAPDAEIYYLGCDSGDGYSQLHEADCLYRVIDLNETLPEGKKIRIVGLAWKRREFPKGYYYFARKAMTCCSNDIAPCGWVCKGERTPDNKTYFTLTALCKRVEGPDGQTALMLNEISTERAKTPKEELVNFVNL